MKRVARSTSPSWLNRRRLGRPSAKSPYTRDKDWIGEQQRLMTKLVSATDRHCAATIARRGTLSAD